MAKKVMYPEIQKEMNRRGETQSDLAKILGLKVSSISRKLRGERQWTLEDAEVMCLHYSNREFWELFRKDLEKEEENGKTI